MGSDFHNEDIKFLSRLNLCHSMGLGVRLSNMDKTVVPSDPRKVKTLIEEYKGRKAEPQNTDEEEVWEHS